MSEYSEYFETRRHQAALAEIAAKQAEVLNHVLDELHATRLPLSDMTAPERRLIDEQVRLTETFDRMNDQLRRLNEGRGR